MADITDLERRVEEIEKRNLRVEKEKAWETSITRKVSIIILTYVVAALVLWILQSPDPFLNALIPTVGFFLSVQSLPMIKRWWMRK